MSKAKALLLNQLEEEVKEYPKNNWNPYTMNKIIAHVKAADLPELNPGEVYKVRSAYYNNIKPYTSKPIMAVRVEKDGQLVRVHEEFDCE